MNKIFTLFIFVLLLISIFSFSVIAKNDKNGKSNENSESKSVSSDSDSSGSSNSDKSENKKDLKTAQIDKDGDDKKKSETISETIIDEQGIKVTIETKKEVENDETKTEEKRTFIDENGNKVTIKTETKIKNGETETEIKRKIVTPDGREIILKTKTEIEGGETKTKNSIEVKGAVVETKLSITEKFEDGQTKLKAELSTGAEQDIITTPDEVLKTALEKIGSGPNGINIELNEIIQNDQRKAVFLAKTTNPGKFLGIFNTNVDLGTLIDAQTGQIIKINRPWWSFLVIGANKATICHISAEDPNKRITINIGITAVKAHLAHGDSAGECTAICGDGILVEGTEICEIGINEIRTCTTIEGYTGTEVCNLLCNGYDVCVTTESCGDGIVNGLEACDDRNTVSGDGCNLCKIEPTPTTTTETPTAETTITTTGTAPIA